MQKHTTDAERVLDELFRLTDVLATDMSGFLERRGLNPTRSHVLWSLRASGPRMQRHLAEELGYSPRHITTLVDDLVALGLVERAAHPHDRRAVLVGLTSAGDDLVTTFEHGRSTLAEQLFGHLGAEAQSHLATTLSDVADRLAAAVQAGEGAP